MMVGEEKSDIREIIPMDEIEEEKEENKKESDDSELLTQKAIEKNLRKLRGKIPSFVIRDLRDNLAGKELTQQKLDKIIAKVVNAYHASMGSEKSLAKTIENINRRLEKLIADVDGLKKKNGRSGKKVDPGSKANISDRVVSHDKERFDDSEDFSIPRVSVRAGKGVLLDDIPEDPVAIMLTIKWLEFIVDKTGVTNLPDVLEFYCDMGWISDEVATKLLKYSRGIKPFFMDDDWKPEEKLSAKDHMLSLMFLERIKGNKISPDFLIQLDRELRRIRSSAEEIYGV